MNNLTALLRRLARPDVPFYALPWLMVLLTAGTIAQRDMGLYAAQAKFFSSWVFWWGPLPLPGGYATIAVIGVALAAKFFIDSKWSRGQAGIILSHFGALLLLAGGLMTAATAREGYVTIAEGAQAAIMEDYHDKHLTVADAQGRIVLDLPAARMHGDMQVAAGKLSFTILEYIHNGIPEEQTAPERNGLPYIGPAAQVRMKPVPADKNEEINHSAVSIAVRGTDSGDGIYLMTDVMPHQPEIAGYRVRFGRVETPLPFAVTLKDVRRELYPGTDVARGYESHVEVHDGAVSWPAVIRMNEPLRYKGYTLYQSNYIREADGAEATVLSAVKNSGWLFPYIASVVIAAGLLIHLVMALRGRRRGAA